LKEEITQRIHKSSEFAGGFSPCPCLTKMKEHFGRRDVRFCYSAAEEVPGQELMFLGIVDSRVPEKLRCK